MTAIRANQFVFQEKYAQAKTLRRWSSGLRWLWNRAIAQQQSRHAAGEKFANYAQMYKWLTEWRADAQTAWLADGPSQPQQQVLRRLEEAYKRFFAQAGGYTKFKRRHH